MKEMKLTARVYMLTVDLLGALLVTWNLFQWQPKDPVMLGVLCILASLALIIKVEGATHRSHYAFSFIVYGFAFAYLGVAAAVVVILVSNLVEYLVNRPAWYGPVFNTACYVFVINVSGLIFQAFNPDSLTNPVYILAITVSMTMFTLINHLMVGIIVWLADGQNFKESGIFDLYPLIVDMSLLTLGALLVLIWELNPFALILFSLPIYLIYSTLRVPALERQSETDPKTGLFNHAYFTQHLDDELKRANRFDRPLTLIMADLDLLRNINNTYGHLAGDEVLIAIANILKKSVREYDVVSRFGGEEFAILMPETALADGLERAETIRRAVEKAEIIIPTSVTPIKASLSLGVANREYFDQTGQDIIHNADTALYHSKLQGRNRAFAYTKDAYVDFLNAEKGALTPKHESDNIHLNKASDTLETNPSAYLTANAKTASVPKPQTPPPQSSGNEEPDSPTSAKKPSKALVYSYIGGLFALAVLMFGSLYLFAPTLYTFSSMTSWLGLAGCVLLLLITELYSIDLYTKDVSLSTSAVPILAGTLLFGPVGSFILGLTYALVTGIKHQSRFNRYVFNFSNQLIAGMTYLIIIFITGRSFVDSPTTLQLGFAITAAIISFGINTGLITFGIHFETGEPVRKFWKENYSWLIFIYIGMGIVAAAFVFGYKHDPLIGSLLVIVPLILLRVSQVQYVERTRSMVGELRKKNNDLEIYSDEIAKLNEGLLDTLAEIIDLRDPYVLGHSRGVTEFAIKLAKRMGLHEKQVELIHKGSLLHDIGKLGISQHILAKPASLTSEEFDVIKTHPNLGAALLEKSPQLRVLIPIVSQHHEFFNGEGYPNNLAGNQITIEARIVSVADAIEAMSTDRPYRKARPPEYIIEELQKCSGMQFDPRVAGEAIKLLKEIESEKATELAIEHAKAQLQKPQKKLRGYGSA
jgi:diguanylate cyclase (GGDEF)-like protein/putative nucleotidyltransferase with HDIG domain